jgi:phage gp29-like protein
VKEQGTKTGVGGQTVVAKIISEFKDRNRAEIKKWQNALKLATNPETPRLYQLQDLYDNLESDGHFISQINLRKAATLCNSFSVIDKKTGDINPEKTDILNSEWFYDFMGYALDSVIKGYTLLELVNPNTMEFVPVPRRNLVPTQKLVLFEAAGDKGIDYSAGFERTLIHIGKEEDLGLMANLCGQLIWKRNAQQSWAEFAEKYGMPLISATTNKTSQADLAKIENMLITLGEAARAVLPEGTTIDIKPFAGSDSYQVYDKQIERINSEIGKPITGGTMISDDGSSRSQSEVHERNLDDKIAMFDRRLIEFTVNGQLFSLLQAWGHNINPETDKFAFDNSFELSLKEHWEVINSALNVYEIPDEWVSKTFNFPITKRREMPVYQQPITAFLEQRKDNAFSQRGGFFANFR